MRHILLLIFVLYLLPVAFSQRVIRGQITDTALSKGIAEASIVVINKTDSAIHSFTRALPDGSFSVPLSDTGTFKLLYTHPQYADFTEDISIKDSLSVVEFRHVFLITRLRMLKEVIISGKGSMRIKGDTTVYIADSFKVGEGANVEELLKQLPGIEVSKDGSIKAQGQTVQKVLVDGDEFFGDDPTIATQNLESKIVDKVEVFDKKSDQAELTGFDDGEKSKTINLKLKKGMNKGLFGKVEASSDFASRSNNRVMLNQFENKRKIAAFGTMGSTYDVNMNWGDASRYGTDQIQMENDNSGMYRYNYDDGGDGGNSLEGHPNLWQGSISFSNKWLEDKLRVNATASYKNKNILRKNNDYTRTIYSTDTIDNTNTEEIFSRRSQPSGSVKLEWKPDTTLTLRAALSLTQEMLDKRSKSLSVNKRNQQHVTSSSERSSTAHSTRNFLKADLTLLKKLKKKGRSVSLSESFSYNGQKGKNTLDAANILESVLQTQDQLSTMLNTSASSYTRIGYTEPLFKEKVLLDAGYSFSYRSGSQDFSTFVKDTFHDQYDNRIDSLSNHFNTVVYTNRGGLKFRLQQKKYNLSAGIDIANARFIQENVSDNLNYDYTRMNIFPVMNFSYRFSSNSSLSFNYSGNTSQPSLFQQQPLSNVSNPLNIVVGNPDLKQEYNQSFNVNFWDYKMMTERTVWIGGYFSNTFQNISSVNTFDAIYGRNITTYENLSGSMNGSFWSGLRRRFGGKLHGGIGFDMSAGQTPYMQNNIRLLQKNTRFSVNPSVSFYLENKFSASLELDFGRTYNKVGSNAWIAFWTTNPRLDLKFAPIRRWKISTDVDFDFRQKSPPFNADFKRISWDAFTSFDINKRRTLCATFTVRDILNQNNGYSRSFDGNTLSESNNLAIRRYWLAGFIWKFNRSKVEKKDNDDDDEFFNN